MRVLAITPVSVETPDMIADLIDKVRVVKGAFKARGIKLVHRFLDDASPHLPKKCRRLVRHKRRKGLACTLVEGYDAVLKLKKHYKYVFRFDCQEHEPWKMLEGVEHMERTGVQSLFLPVFYWIDGSSCPPMTTMSGALVAFVKALNPLDERTVLETYNRKFPMGFQGFRLSRLPVILRQLKRGARAYAELAGEEPTWGFDLLALLIAAREGGVDFLFGGYPQPWTENRSVEKIRQQEERARLMIQIIMRFYNM